MSFERDRIAGLDSALVPVQKKLPGFAQATIQNRRTFEHGSMKRSRNGRGSSDLLGRVGKRLGGNRATQPHEPDPSSKARSRRARFIGAGLVIIVPAFGATVLARPDTTDAPAKVAQVLESMPQSPRPSSRARRTPTDAPVTASTAGQNVAITFERGSRVSLGYIEIPAIDLRTRFYDGVVDESVERGPGHWPGTPWPGEPGNSVFAGHRTTFTRPFADLDLLNEGQRVIAQVRNGPKTTYRILRTTVVSEAEYVDFVLKQPRNRGVRMITLFACTPKGSRTHRIVVQAKAVSATNHEHAEEDKEGAMEINR